MKTPYRGYDVLAKWHGPSFDDTTRQVLDRRLRRVPQRVFFTEAEGRLLEAVVARLLPQPDRARPVPIMPWIDDMLAAGRGEGFRHDDMPPADEVWRTALAAIDAEARRRHGGAFADLGPELQDETLRAVQRGEVDPAPWGRIPPPRFFSDQLLKTVAGIYYSHPAAWSEVGFGGPASPRGYVRMGFDERDPWDGRESEGSDRRLGEEQG